MNNDLSLSNSLHLPSSLPPTDSKPLSGKQTAIKEGTVGQNWKAQHKVEKHEGFGILTPLVMTTKAIAGLAFLSIALIPVTIAKTFNAISEKYTIYRQPESPLAKIREMKKQEETDKLDTMKKVLDDFPELSKVSPKEGAKSLTENLTTRLRDNQLEQNRGARYILRELSKKEPFDPAWIKALNDQNIIKTLSFDDIGVFPETLTYQLKENYPSLKNIEDIRLLDWKKISHKAQKRTIKPKNIEKEVRMYERSLKELLTILKNSDSNHSASTNQELVAALRKALSSRVYEALKDDPNNSSVQLLHRLASDLWNKAPSMDAYCDVGQSIVEEMDIPDGEMDGAALAEHLEKSHKTMSELHYTDHGLGKISYGLTHPAQLLGSMASEGGVARTVASTVGKGVYDSHGKLANNPSLQGTTTLSLKSGKKAEVRNCYGGSPTIGDHRISPEFKAAIQAAENNQMLPPDKRDKNIPTMVIYNNLQSLDKKHGEGPRSRTIMLLNEKYPLSFRGATFSKDSALYMMPEGAIWKADDDPSEFGKIMRAQLDRSFNPNEKGHGFYFHGSKEKWDPIFDQVFELANAHFQKLKDNQSELYINIGPEGLQGAYQEYVYSLLNSAIEMDSVQTLIKKGIDDPTIMVITACKENIDRGGMENTKYLYNRLNETEEQDRLPLIMGAMHSRALSARDRIILKKRMTQILSYMKTTSPETFKDDQMKLFALLDYPVSESKYQPYLKKYQQEPSSPANQPSSTKQPDTEATRLNPAAAG